MTSITRLYFSVILLVLLFFLISFLVVVTKNEKHDTTIPLSVSGPTMNTADNVYIADGERTSIISSFASPSSNNNINNDNQARQHSPSFSQNHMVNAVAATRGASGKVKLATADPPTSQPTVQPSTYPTKTSAPLLTLPPYPTATPTFSPGQTPSGSSCDPTQIPTMLPLIQYNPTANPTFVNGTQIPTFSPGQTPSGSSSSNIPSFAPHGLSTMQPTAQPSGQPSEQPSAQPSQQPTT